MGSAFGFLYELDMWVGGNVVCPTFSESFPWPKIPAKNKLSEGSQKFSDTNFDRCIQCFSISQNVFRFVFQSQEIRESPPTKNKTEKSWQMSFGVGSFNLVGFRMVFVLFYMSHVGLELVAAAVDSSGSDVMTTHD